MSESTYPLPTRSLTRRPAEASPEIYKAFQEFSRRAFADHELPEKTKQLIAVAVATTTQCPYCIRGRTRLAKRRGASEQQIMEAIWVAAEARRRRVRALAGRARRARRRESMRPPAAAGRADSRVMRQAVPGPHAHVTATRLRSPRPTRAHTRYP